MCVRRLIVGNWKMHGRGENLADIEQLALCMAKEEKPGAQVVICPPATLLREAARIVRAAGPAISVEIGAQDCAAEADGPFTGDLSAAMLRESGASYVILGHSERRSGHAETGEEIGRKIKAALEAELVPIVCFGEDAHQRANNRAVPAVLEQIRACVPALHGAPFVAAYEPIWAIGSGNTPNSAEIAQMHETIRAAVHAQGGGSGLRVLYGGSVRACNCLGLLANPGVDGLLVGAASLDTAAFFRIITAAA